MKRIVQIFLCFLLMVFFSIGCNHPVSKSVENKTIVEGVYAIQNVNVITMTNEGEYLKNVTVIVKDGKIESLNGDIPKGAQIINGKGKWLIPGLIDMHVHIPTDGHFNTNFPTRAAVVFDNIQDVMTPFVANGVTTVFDLNARAGHFGQRNEILRGDVIGPRMALAAMINGGEGDGRIANTPSDGRQAVRMAKAEGYEFIKVYSQLNKETFYAIVDEAKIHGMKVIGHIPNVFNGEIDKSIVPHFGLVAHAEEVFKHVESKDSLEIVRLADLFKKNGTSLCPTLIIIESAHEQSRSLDGLKKMNALQYVHPLLQDKWITSNNYNKNASAESISRLEKMMYFNSRLVEIFNKNEIPILAGTDAGSSGVVWGFSLHDELGLLVKSGLSPYEALAAATKSPAAWLGLLDKIGTVEVGKYADLILLDYNPLLDIRNTRKISGVFFNGLWVDKQKIEQMLSELSKRNELNKNRFEWSKRSEY